MRDNITDSRPYAEAAFKISSDENMIDAWLSNLNILGLVINDAEVKAILSSPKIDNSDKIKFIVSFCDSKSKLFEKFIEVLLQSKKIYNLDSISHLFNEMVLEQGGVSVVQIETPFELSSQQKTELTKTLQKQFNQKIKIQEIINKNLLAGIKISTNNEVIDHSIKRRIDSMRESIITNNR
ncbi:MAG: hypothetical protein CMD43_01475 [Gammaproteobacteria bacterium]|nr:hypothetical protein [Gammaproteobacteria bacterium]